MNDLARTDFVVEFSARMRERNRALFSAWRKGRLQAINTGPCAGIFLRPFLGHVKIPKNVREVEEGF